jgi:hypothetical protein
MSLTGLRAGVWAKASLEERMGELQSLENDLALQDRREPCQLSIEDLSPRTRGVHYFDPTGDEHIALNTSLVDVDMPYQAVETLFHEDQHAHQNYVVQHPELAENRQQLEDWQMSEQGGYISPDETTSFSDYRWQPTEKDANEQARLKTDELYQDEFNDIEQYPVYKQGKEQDLSDDMTLAQHELGEDYVEKARQSMIAYHDYHQAQQQGSLESPGQDQAEGSQPTSEIDTSPADDEGYTYGYGY